MTLALVSVGLVWAAKVGELEPKPAEGSEAELETIFSWTGAKDAAVVEGGAITAADKDGADKTMDLINVEQKNFYTIKVDGKKDFTSGNTITIKLDKALEAGDKIAITAFRNKNAADKKSGLLAKFDKGDKTISTVSSDKEKAGLEFVNLDDSDASAADKNRGTEPNTIVLDIPEEAAGSTTITLTRAETSTNLFVTKLVILGDRNPDKDLSFNNYKSLDFNSAVNGAVSRGGRHAGDITAANGYDKTNPLIITADGNSVEIYPNTATDNYPDGAEPCSKFIETVAGPQLVLSGGYAGVLLHVQGTDINQINLNVTNWNRAMIATDNTVASTDTYTYMGEDYSVKNYKTIGTLSKPEGNVITWKAEDGVTYSDVYFIVKADTTWVGHWETLKDESKVWKRDEIVLHGMGTMKINSIEINPVYDVVYDVADGAELSAAYAEAFTSVKNAKSVTLNLAAGGNYTITNSITTAVPLTIKGNDATVDASGNSGNIISLNGATAKVIKPDGNEDASHYYISSIEISDVKILGIKGSLIKDDQKILLEKLTVNNSVIEMAANKQVINFQGKGYVGEVVFKNSTLYSTLEKHEQFFAQYGSRLKNIDGAENAGWLQTFDIENCTFNNIAVGKNVCDFSMNSQKCNVYTLKNNIFANVGKSGQTVVGFNKGGVSANPVWTVDGNVFNHSNADTSAAEISKAGKKDDKDIVANSIAGVVTFADAAKGDFTQTLTDAAGDPRWIGGGSPAITGIEAVKEAKTAEDGAWYTIQGQRVAQPTKGLYIHNGKKVVIK